MSKQLITYYRDFQRLAKYIPKLKHRTLYSTYLKNNFLERGGSYSQRRALVLSHDAILPNDITINSDNKTNPKGDVTNDEQEYMLTTRLPRTLAFVQRSVQYEKNELHSTIFRNLLKFQESKQLYQEKKQRKDPLLSYKFAKNTHFENLDNEKKDELMSLREMERLVMRLNETEGLCL